jgi:hypothetical protein
MEFDETIARLETKFDAWLDGDLAAFKSQDRTAQAEALLRGFEIVKELDKLKADGLAAIALLLDSQNPTPAEDRVASLVRAFALAAHLRDALHELGDPDGPNELVLKMNAIASMLDETASGRAALAPLLEHAKDGVRASACAYLVNLMPDRVVPILREIDQNDGGTSASFTAHWALSDWELKQKTRAAP